MQPIADVRIAELTDTAAICRLCCELGCPSDIREVRVRLSKILASERHVGMVAINSCGEVQPWIAAEVRQTLESGRRAEVVGLIIDRQMCRRGVGTRRLHAVERWAAKRSLTAIVVRSNRQRSGAHAFCLALGFETMKTQEVQRLGIKST